MVKVSVKTTDISEGVVAASVANSAGETEKDGGTATTEDWNDAGATSKAKILDLLEKPKAHQKRHQPSKHKRRR